MLRREVLTFLIVGAATVMVDYLTYQLLLCGGIKPLELAKSLGFITGTGFAFVANRWLTFAARRQSVLGTVWRFGVLYMMTLGVNVFINALLLHALNQSLQAMSVAFIGATATSATLNFLGMKYFVFTPDRLKEA